MPDQDLSAATAAVETIAADVAKLSPGAGDIVHVRLHRHLTPAEASALVDQLSEIAPDARFLVTDGTLDLSVLTSAQLAEMGLARLGGRLILPH